MARAAPETTGNTDYSEFRYYNYSAAEEVRSRQISRHHIKKLRYRIEISY